MMIFDLWVKLVPCKFKASTVAFQDAFDTPLGPCLLARLPMFVCSLEEKKQNSCRMDWRWGQAEEKGTVGVTVVKGKKKSVRNERAS